MSDIEVKQVDTVTREEAAQRLTALAAGLVDGGKVELTLGAGTVKVHVPDEVRCEVEVEIDGGEVELEVELKWSTGKVVRAAPARRGGTAGSRRPRGAKA